MAAERRSLLASLHICVCLTRSQCDCVSGVLWACAFTHFEWCVRDEWTSMPNNIFFRIQMLRFGIRPDKISYSHSINQPTNQPTKHTIRNSHLYIDVYQRTFTFSRFLYISIYFEKLVVWPVFFSVVIIRRFLFLSRFFFGIIFNIIGKTIWYKYRYDRKTTA